MSLQAPEFFAELCLPFHDHAVVGNTYFAAPVPGAPLRLRIDFTRTIHADTYGGLRLAVVHPDRGEIDAVALSFVDHGTFHRRDEATNTRPEHQAVRHLRQVPPPRPTPVGRRRHHRAARRHRAVHRRLVPRRLGRVRAQPCGWPYTAQHSRPAGRPRRGPHPLSPRTDPRAARSAQPSRQEPRLVCPPLTTPSRTSTLPRP